MRQSIPLQPLAAGQSSLDKRKNPARQHAQPLAVGQQTPHQRSAQCRINTTALVKVEFPTTEYGLLYQLMPFTFFF